MEVGHDFQPTKVYRRVSYGEEGMIMLAGDGEKRSLLLLEGKALLK